MNNDGCNTTVAATEEVNEENGVGGGEKNNPHSYSAEGIVELRTILAASPFHKLCKKADAFFYQERQRRRNQSKYKRQRLEDSDVLPWEAEAKVELRSWFAKVKDKMPCCINLHRRRPNPKCTCVQSLDDRDAAEMFLYLVKQEKSDRKILFKSWMAASQKAYQVKIRLPCCFSNAGFQVICTTAFQNIFSIGIRKFKSLRHQIQAGNMEFVQHGLTGRPSNCSKNSKRQLCKDDVVKFLEDFAMEHRESIGATRFAVRNDDDENNDEMDLVYLPSHYSMRGIYCAYLHHNGWQIPKPTANGKYPTQDELERRMDDDNDDEWPDGMEPSPVCALSSFHFLWKQFCPHIVIRPDIKNPKSNKDKNKKNNEMMELEERSDSSDGSVATTRQRTGRPAEEEEEEDNSIPTLGEVAKQRPYFEPIRRLIQPIQSTPVNELGKELRTGLRAEAEQFGKSSTRLIMLAFLDACDAQVRKKPKPKRQARLLNDD